MKTPKKYQTAAEFSFEQILKTFPITFQKEKRLSRKGSDYFADFFVDDFKIVFEIDGEVHGFKMGRDLKRDLAIMSEKHIYVMRIKNKEVFEQRVKLRQSINRLFIELMDRAPHLKRKYYQSFKDMATGMGRDKAMPEDVGHTKALSHRGIPAAEKGVEQGEGTGRATIQPST